MNRLTLTNVSKTYPNGTVAMSDINLELSNGMFGLLGPNGAGKSTLMRTIAGLQQPGSGTITFNGTNIVSDVTFIRKQLGYLPQDFGVYPKCSAVELLDHLAVLKGVTSKASRRDQINALLEKTNLFPHRNKAVSGYSGGMRQRFGIAQALLGDPKLIIVDEPTAGLDPAERNRFNNLLSELGEQIIVILSTHLVEDVYTLCTRMAIMNKGQLQNIGEPRKFINDLDGRIWMKQVAKKDLALYSQRQNIISTQLQSGAPNIYVYAETDPGDGFIQKKATLEDVYFTQVKQQQ